MANLLLSVMGAFAELERALINLDSAVEIVARTTKALISALESNARQIGRERVIVLARALIVHPAALLLPDFDIKNVA